MSTRDSNGNGRRLSILIVGVSRRPETFLVRLIYGLADAGVSVTVACERKSHWPAHPNLHLLRAPGWNNDWGIRIPAVLCALPHALTSGREDLKLLRPDGGSLLRDRDAAERWYRILPFAGRRWDLIYFPWNSAAIVYEPLFHLGMPVVISCRGAQVNVSPHDRANEWLRKGMERTFARAAAVHCVSEAIQGEACQYGLDPARSFINRPAVHADFFRPADRKEEHPETLRVITVGTINWRKAHEFALLAARRLADLSIPSELEIVGDGPDRQRILFAIQDLNLQEQVRLSGALSPSAVRDRLQQADVFLLSSMSEGISNAVLEAMACGLPIVCTDCGGMREVITDGVEGFLVPVNDWDAMAARLAVLRADRGLREGMGAAARARVMREFTLDRQVAIFISQFQEAANRSVWKGARV